MAKLSTIVLGLILILATGCDTGERISRLEKENADLKVQVEKEHVALDYDLQAKCSKDARTWFNENWSRDKTTVLLTFSNHYQKSSNKCFIFVEFHYSEGLGSSWTNDMTLWNVYDNSKYGAFGEDHIIDYKNGGTDRIITCELLDKKCRSLDEFNQLLQPYLND